MAALPEHRDGDGIGRRAERPGVPHDRARCHRRIVVHRQRVVRFREAREQAVLEHGGGARQRFFGRLADQHQRTAPGLAVLRHQFCGAIPGRHVQVVATGVRHRHGVPGGIFRRDLAGERQTGLFQHWQCIHLGAQHHGRSRTILEDGHDAGATDACGHLEAERLGPFGQLGRGLVFRKAKFGVGVQVTVEGFELGKVGRQLGVEWRRKRRGVGANLGQASEQAGGEDSAAEGA
jgi:hypothetical protein